jgi:manganese-dependent inorganic pyrophosphatase
MLQANCWALSYINPDADGVICSLTYAALFKGEHAGSCLAGAFGGFNAETKVILDFCNLEFPVLLDTVPDVGDFVLVDTHHIAQLPDGFPPARVMLIIDHHTAGDVDLFRHAEIVNERVGAAATLIYERAVAGEHPLEPEIARALAAAIISNTLEFAAPSTSERDRQAFRELAQLGGWIEAFTISMREARSELLDGPLNEILKREAKTFDFGSQRIVISQLEVPSGEVILTRKDSLEEGIDDLARDLSAAGAILNIVDLGRKFSTLVVTSEKLRRLLGEALALDFQGSFASSSRILLRKTDIVPCLKVGL